MAQDMARRIRRGARGGNRPLVARAHARLVSAEDGQATAEYGLVVVAAAGIAAALIAFGKSGFETFFERVVDTIVNAI